MNGEGECEMKHFLIQTNEHGQLLHDFSFRLMEAIGFAEWKYGQKVYGHSFSVSGETVDDLLQEGIEWEDIIPVGSLEYVFERMGQLGYKGVSGITPLNVPNILQKPDFLNRQYQANLSKREVVSQVKEFPVFIKSADRYKGFLEVVETPIHLDGLPLVGRYDVSELMDIQAEWRIFVQQDEIVGAKSYGSDDLFPKPPNERFLKRMVRTIEKERQNGASFPLSYTLDVGVSLDGSFLVEAHPFVSCGLYGFENLERLPSMMIQGFAFFKEQALHA